MKQIIVAALAVAVLSACGSPPTSHPSTAPASTSGEQAIYLERCKGSPSGSNKTTFDAQGNATCFNGHYRYSEMCKNSPTGSGKTTTDAQGNMTCYSGTMVIPGGPEANFLP